MLGTYVRYEPHTEADAYFADYRKPVGYCAECGYEVYKADECKSDDEAPTFIERMWFHDKCVMTYAQNHWRIN